MPVLPITQAAIARYMTLCPYPLEPRRPAVPRRQGRAPEPAHRPAADGAPARRASACPTRRRRTPCATRSPRTCCRPAPTCARSRSCWATPACRPPRSTPRSTASGCSPSTTRRIRVPKSEPATVLTSCRIMSEPDAICMTCVRRSDHVGGGIACACIRLIAAGAWLLLGACPRQRRGPAAVLPRQEHARRDEGHRRARAHPGRRRGHRERRRAALEDRARRQAALHLFGTMHLTDERITELSPALKAALGGSRRLVLEDRRPLAPTTS